MQSEQRDDDYSVRSSSVSTRKLIIASLICGLLILVAGTLKLLQTASEPEATTTLLALGSTAELGPVSVAVRDVEVTTEQTLVDVVMRVVDGASIEATTVNESWSLLADGEITAPIAPAACEQTAGGASGDAASEGGALTCTLTFVAARGTPTIVYARDGEKRQWLGS
ncbi:MAG: hypothetical protein EBV41_05510 [Actinobacteria bacterium]|nr:hypothetical protein [Actinomycetota bacterium]NDG76313.1 hypothetical protein [Acidimicrobiia bacterium]NBO33041.1 hypothetical protein [Actinomycetota bacterium]NBO80862.1 hypothetical protein [Actinomycetota bacterium]NBY57142.1 hypothetical protein [Actinomycetota bacterium]